MGKGNKTSNKMEKSKKEKAKRPVKKENKRKRDSEENNDVSDTRTPEEKAAKKAKNQAKRARKKAMRDQVPKTDENGKPYSRVKIGRLVRKIRKAEQKKFREEARRKRELKKEAKKAEKTALLEQVPKTDEDGIAYTKIQIRRMVRRMKRGLPPVPTEEEERERLRQEKIEKELEEKELAGMLHDNKEESEDEEEEDEKDTEDEEDDGSNGSDGEDTDEDRSTKVTESGESEEQKAVTAPVKKKTKRAKPVPADYVCMACKNKHDPPHWIYDCPDKVRVPGTNKVAKKLRGIQQPDSRKVFVSGLPFEIKQREVEQYFAEKCGDVVHCKILCFEDTKRCKGQAFLTFETDEAAQRAIKTSGEIFDYEPADEDGKKKKKKKKRGSDHDGGSEKKKELRLKVTPQRRRNSEKLN